PSGSIAEKDGCAPLGADDPRPSGSEWASPDARTWKSRSPSMTDLAAQVKKASDAGKCFDPATNVLQPRHLNDRVRKKSEARQQSRAFLFRTHQHEGLPVAFGDQRAVLLEGLMMKFDDAGARSRF